MDENKTRLIATSLKIEFDSANISAENFAREFNKLTKSDDDPVGEWLRMARAKKGGSGDDFNIVLDLLVEIYRKLGALENAINNISKEYAPLRYCGEIETIGHGCFAIRADSIKINQSYLKAAQKAQEAQNEASIESGGLDSIESNGANSIESSGADSIESTQNSQNLPQKIEIPRFKFEPNALYYARVELPIFPVRILPVYFIFDKNLARIEKMHSGDESEWDGYVASKERALIRTLRAQKGKENG